MESILNILISQVDWYNLFADKEDEQADMLYNHLKRYIHCNESNVLPKVIFSYLIFELEDRDLTREEIDVANKYKQELDAMFWKIFDPLFEDLYQQIKHDKTFATKNFFSNYNFISKEDCPSLFKGKKYNSAIANKITNNRPITRFFNKKELNSIYCDYDCLTDAINSLLVNLRSDYKTWDQFLSQDNHLHNKEENKCIDLVKTYKILEKEFFDNIERSYKKE